jgi:quercetin dioxygenase-like cupin family protein
MGNYRVVDNEQQPVVELARGSRSRVLAGASTGASCMAVVERWLDPGAQVPVHRHPPGVEEVIWIRDGQGEFEVDGERALIGPDHTLVIAPLSRHGFRVVGDETLSLLCRYSAPVPAILEEDGRVGASEIPDT